VTWGGSDAAAAAIASISASAVAVPCIFQLPAMRWGLGAAGESVMPAAYQSRRRPVTSGGAGRFRSGGAALAAARVAA